MNLYNQPIGVLAKLSEVYVRGADSKFGDAKFRPSNFLFHVDG
jgi:hypothetical protein